MSVFGSIASLNGIQFYIQSITATQVPRTKKQTMGAYLIENRVLGYSTLQLRLSIRGAIVGATADADRASMEAVDDGTAHAYVDGHHDGNFFIPRGGLQWDDDGSSFNTYRFSMELIAE